MKQPSMLCIMACRREVFSRRTFVAGVRQNKNLDRMEKDQAWHGKSRRNAFILRLLL